MHMYMYMCIEIKAWLDIHQTLTYLYRCLLCVCYMSMSGSEG